MHAPVTGTAHTQNLGPQRASYLSPMCAAIEAGLVCRIPLTVDTDDIPAIKVVETIKEGRTVYPRRT